MSETFDETENHALFLGVKITIFSLHHSNTNSLDES